MSGNVKGARLAALKAIERVASGGAYADIILEASLEGLGEADRSLAAEIIYGVLRWQIRIDWIIDSFSTIPAKKLEDRVLNALRIGVYQLYFLTKIPRHSAVDESVKLVSGKKRAGFVNAVLRKAAQAPPAYPPLAEDPAGHVAIVYSHPLWMVRRWLERFGVDETIEVCAANQLKPPKTLRVNTLLTSRDALMGKLQESGLEVKESVYSPDGITVVRGRLDPLDRRFYIQDEASQLIPYILSPRPGELVLDACSAPGGKTTHMAQLMANSGLIYALDRRGKRLRSVEETAKRLGVAIIKTFQADAAGPLGLDMAFDAILVDAPCSGLGVLRRNPDIKLKLRPGDIRELSARQASILDNAALYLKKGGRLVYSVCTNEPEETDEIIGRFLNGHRDFGVEDAGGILPANCIGLVDSGFLRTFPHRHGMDGFFAARIRRA